MNRLPLALAVLLAGCGPELAAPAPAPIPTTTGVSLNGTMMRGAGGPFRGDECESTGLAGSPTPYSPCHNGPLLAGQLVSVALAGVTLANGQALDGAAALAGTAFTGTAGGAPVASFVGATFSGQKDDGSTVPVRIDSAAAGTGNDANVWAYGISYYDGASEAWWPVCAGGVAAVPVMGRWDYSFGTATGGDKIDDPASFTFGCIGSAIAKCVYLGYKPWQSVSGVSLGNHHQACTRAIRADYCGNGASYTTTGRVIDIYDTLGVQADTEGWIPEGEWMPGGAKCTFALNRNIVAGLLCHPAQSLTCGHWEPGVLLLTESPLVGGVLGAGGGVATQPQ